MIRRLLIANRGEIACRIARTCARMGIEFVAVYSDADAASPHLRGAVATSRIGPPAAAQSYLDQERILAAAREHGCDAIHPGYGFLSENAQFARAVGSAGLRFVGPSPAVIAALGDKARAKELMRGAGVPTVPGMAEASEDLAVLERAARETGYPLLLKPSAGGGGKGMHVVREPAELRETLERAMRLARAHFGDGRLILERYLDRARHVEVQVFGDSQGHVVHLFERDCSLQRRHQKIVEEAPAPGLSDELRARLFEAAVRGAKAAGYDNAGTFEFLVGPAGEFYFLEVNTRLQVEHPVTEAITGLDLVEWQLRCASGEPLPLAQQDIRASGHAFECRVYAEDPENDFAPAPGRALHVSWPQGVRIEAGIVSGSEVPPHYDPLVAKLITWGQSRAEARAAMLTALRDTVVLGLTTNLGALQRILNHPSVAQGAYHTQVLDQVLDPVPGNRGAKPRNATATAVACACAATLALERARQPRWPWSAVPEVGPFDRASLAPEAPLGELNFWAGRDLHKGAIVRCDDSGVEVRVGAETFCVRIDAEAGPLLHSPLLHSPVLHGTVSHGPLSQSAVLHGPQLHSTAGGSVWHAMRAGAAQELMLDGTRHSLQAYADRNPAQYQAAASALSPMPGVVVSLPVKLRQTVSEGEVLAIVEAMKMENKVTAAFAGTVTAINCRLNETVNAGDLLVTVEPSG
ncbi:MAG: acetyl/propionyl/methylcrotonyl-CoA carboxylase subunit alpha [SAR324 cluster bacterium]